MKIAVLTSSRADYGIYQPLLKALEADPFFDLRLIVFGSHLAKNFGLTINQIINDGYIIDHKIDEMPADDSPLGISASIGKTIKAFGQVWKSSSYDLVLALGDRFEMFAAVVSGLPFNVRFAHIHGGETTLGAIDDAFRHSISLMSEYHFTSAETYKNRVAQIIGKDQKIFNTGSLGIDFLSSLELLSKEEFKIRYNIDLTRSFILSTIHPETVSFERNAAYMDEFVKAMMMLDGYQIIVTMPNADTSGMVIREKLHSLSKERDNVILVENFGSVGYLSCMKHCEMLIGNTSSGFYDASFFPKWVINLGDRQKGRIRTPNILDVEFDTDDITKAIELISGKPLPLFEPVYGDGHAASKIIKILKDEFSN